jgi:hypothetical protein
MRGLLIHFISNIEVRSDPTTSNFVNQIQNVYFCSEIRTNPIGSDSGRICTPLIDCHIYHFCSNV